MHRWFMVASMGLFLAGCAAQEMHHKPQPVTPEMKQSMEQPKTQWAGLDSTKALTSDAFAAKVAAAGGRVDFIFGKDRPFQQCHASTITQTADGTLLSAWFGGTEEKNPDVSIWTSRFLNGAWTAPVQAAKVQPCAHWNPVLFTDAEGATHLFFKVGPDIDFWQTWWTTSRDNGATWSTPVELVPFDKGGRGPVKNKPIILSDGSWLAPASTEYQHWWCFSDRSEDHGLTWTRSADFVQDINVLKGEGCIQPTFWESAPGRVHALVRTEAGRTWRADSADYGRTWAPMYALELPNNNSGIDALGLCDGRVLLVFNPVEINDGPRTPLDLAVSKDNGATWTSIAHLENDPNLDSEYSYPAIIRTKDGIAITYTFNRDTMRCWQIPMSALD